MDLQFRVNFCGRSPRSYPTGCPRIQRSQPNRQKSGLGSAAPRAGLTHLEIAGPKYPFVTQTRCFSLFSCRLWHYGPRLHTFMNFIRMPRLLFATSASRRSFIAEYFLPQDGSMLSQVKVSVFPATIMFLTSCSQVSPAASQI